MDLEVLKKKITIAHRKMRWENPSRTFDREQIVKTEIRGLEVKFLL
jgi:hypothetical protein